MSWNVYGKRIRRKLVQFPADSEDRGEFCPAEFCIKVDKSLNTHDRIQTELHEITHGILERLSITETRIPDSVQEIICNGFATFILENETMLSKRFEELKKERKKGIKK